MRVAVGSGKGGTGKTLLSTSLALSQGCVRYLDLDVEEPNGHIFIKPDIRERIPFSIPVPQVDFDRCTYCGECAKACEFGAIFVGANTVNVFEKLCHGCASCKLACPENAISEKPYIVGEISIGKRDKIEYIMGYLKLTEALSTPLIRHIKKVYGTVSGDIIIDAPPGTSCPFVQSISDVDFVLLITEPTPFGLSDLEIAVEIVKDMDLKAGIVINKADLGSGEVKDRIYGLGLPVLLEIPFSERIAVGYSKGIPFVDVLPEYRNSMKQLWERIKGMV